MCRVCARTMRKSRDTSRAAFIWRVKTFGQPYHITLSTKSSDVPPTSRNNKFSHIFSPRRALVLPLWAQHNLRTTVLTRGDNHDTDWTKNQNKQKKTLFLLDRRVTSFRTYFFFFLLFFSRLTLWSRANAPRYGAAVGDQRRNVHCDAARAYQSPFLTCKTPLSIVTR